LQVCKFFRNRKQKFSQYFFVGLYNLLGLYLSGDRYLRKSFPASGGGANKKLCSALQDFLFALPIFRAFVMAVFLGLCSALGSPEKNRYDSTFRTRSNNIDRGFGVLPN